MKSIERTKARELRTQGMSIHIIADQLKVSASSVSLWVRDIVLSPAQIKVLEDKNPFINGQMAGAKARSEKAKIARVSYQEAGKEKAKENNLLHQAGCMLYWAEGAKSRTRCAFVNSDVHMMELFLKFIRTFYAEFEHKITLTISYYTNNGLTGDDIKKYWLTALNLKSDTLRKCQEDNLPKSSKRSRRPNKLPYGVACVSINSVELIQNIYGAIQEYAGFHNDYMLM